MICKNLPSWLKGGIVGLGTFLFLIFIAQVLIAGVLTGILPHDEYSISFCGAYPFICSIREAIRVLIFGLDIFGILLCQGFCHGEEQMTQILTMPISYTFYGIVIGFIWGLLKANRN